MCDVVLDVGKHVRLRKEALNVIISLAKKLKRSDHVDDFSKLCSLFERVLPVLNQDGQPEIKSRLADVKMLLKEN